MKTSRSIAAVVLAAGRSVRFRSSRSKLVHPLGGRPILSWVLDTLHARRVAPIVVVVGFDRDGVAACCGPDVRLAVQEAPQGTGHAVLAAQRTLRGFTGTVLILNGDLPLIRPQSLSRLLTTHRRSSADLTMATAAVDDPHGWGRVVRHGNRVQRIVEERDATPAEKAIREVNVGLYAAEPRFLFRTLRRLSPDNAQGEIYLTDVVEEGLRRGRRVAAVSVPVQETAQVNTRAELARLEKRVRAEINAGWMAMGVTLLDPDTTYIEAGVRIGPDTVLGPNVHLRGKTVIGRDCRIDGTSYLSDARLGDGVHIKFGVTMAECRIGDGCEIGPFANIRPASILTERNRIGNFVETKNARLGPGSKASHLAYLGDATIGRETNIGAGTITCNYDGFRKHHTEIGDRVQVGSDSQLVAPVRVADDAYVATATTVRENVPAGALVFNRREQVAREGWVAERRARAAQRPRRESTAEPQRRKGRKKAVGRDE